MNTNYDNYEIYNLHAFYVVKVTRQSIKDNS